MNSLQRFLPCLILTLACSLPARAQTTTWSSMPADSDWNNAANWSAGVPNSSTADAIFNTSSITSPALSADTEVDSILFTGDPFDILATPGNTLTISGTGVASSTANPQELMTETSAGGDYGQIHFRGAAVANLLEATDVSYLNNGALIAAVPGITNFYDMSGAGFGVFLNEGGQAAGAGGGATQFLDTGTSADDGIFINYGGVTADAFGGSTNFLNGTAENSFIMNDPGGAVGAGAGRTIFQNSATAAEAKIDNNGATVAGADGGRTEFFDTSTAGNSRIRSYGSEFGNGGVTLFAGTPANVFQSSNAGTAFLEASDGVSGGSIQFIWYASGDMARVHLEGRGNLDISGLFSEGTTIGSLNGDGIVNLGSKELTIGTDDSVSFFSGIIQDGGLQGGTGGSLRKVGTGTLTLESADPLVSFNTFTGTTTLDEGVLAIGGAGVGNSDVIVHGGTLRFHDDQHGLKAASYSQDGGTLQLRIGGPGFGTGENDAVLVEQDSPSAAPSPSSASIITIPIPGTSPPSG